MSNEYMDVEFGGMGADAEVGGFWGNLWGGIKKAAKAVYSSKAAQDVAAKALNNVSPGAGDAFSKGMKLINKANSGDQKALEQIKQLSASAKAGDTTVQPAHQLLVGINEGRKEAKAEALAGLPAAVGADPMVEVTLPNGEKLRIKQSKLKDFNKRLAAHKRAQAKRQAARRGAAQWQGKQATPKQVQQAIQRVPPAARPALAQRIVQASLPQAMQPYAQPQAPYGYGPPQPGYPQRPGAPTGYAQSNEQFPEDDGGQDEMPDFEPEAVPADVEFPEE